MCQQSDPNERYSDDNDTGNTGGQAPGREDPSLKNKDQQAAQRQPNVPGRDEDEDESMGDEGGRSMGRDQNAPNKQRAQEGESKVRDLAGGQDMNAD